MLTDPTFPQPYFSSLKVHAPPDVGPLQMLFSLEHDFLPTHLPTTELERDFYVIRIQEGVLEFSNPWPALLVRHSFFI